MKEEIVTERDNEDNINDSFDKVQERIYEFSRYIQGGDLDEITKRDENLLED